LVLAGVMGALSLGCAAVSERAGVEASASQGSMPRLADGTVPWADLVAEDAAFSVGATPMPVVNDEAGPCSADQFEAEVANWFLKGDNDEGRPRSAADGLIGMVEVRNRSDRDCTLQGEVPVTMTSSGGAVDLSTSHAINDEARDRVTPVPAGAGATLRVDWDPPFCVEDLADLALELQLPDSGGVLRAPVSKALLPACTDLGQPTNRSLLASSGFDIERAASTLDSPFNPVTVAIESPPAQVEVGTELRFHVVLTNPTSLPIAFDPPPGYVLELFSVSDGFNEPINTSMLRFLNHLTVAELPPGPTRFETVIPLPDELGPGRAVNLSWRLLHPGLASVDAHSVGFPFETT